jgi:hypothetical protein
LRGPPTPSQPTSPPIKKWLKTHHPKQPHPKRKIKCTKLPKHQHGMSNNQAKELSLIARHPPTQKKKLIQLDKVKA